MPSPRAVASCKKPPCGAWHSPWLAGPWPAALLASQCPLGALRVPSDPPGQHGMVVLSTTSCLQPLPFSPNPWEWASPCSSAGYCSGLRGAGVRGWCCCSWTGSAPCGDCHTEAWGGSAHPELPTLNCPSSLQPSCATCHGAGAVLLQLPRDARCWVLQAGISAACRAGVRGLSLSAGREVRPGSTRAAEQLAPHQEKVNN